MKLIQRGKNQAFKAINDTINDELMIRTFKISTKQDFKSKMAMDNQMRGKKGKNSAFNECCIAAIKNKARYTATPVACTWAGAVFEVT